MIENELPLANGTALLFTMLIGVDALGNQDTLPHHVGARFFEAD